MKRAAAAGRLGVPADAFTYLSLILAGAAGVAAANGWLATAGLLVLVGGACDLCDGAAARATGTSSRWGALLDSTVDRLADGVPLLGIAVFYAGDGTHVLVPGLAILAGYAVSYVRARSEALGIDLPPLFMRRAERVALLVLSLLAGRVPFPGVGPRAPLTLLGLALLAAASLVALFAAMRAARRGFDSLGALETPGAERRVDHGPQASDSTPTPVSRASEAVSSRPTEHPSPPVPSSGLRGVSRPS